MRRRTSQTYAEVKIAHATEKVISGDMQIFYFFYAFLRAFIAVVFSFMLKQEAEDISVSTNTLGIVWLK